jgi:hypothetical protein
MDPLILAALFGATAPSRMQPDTTRVPGVPIPNSPFVSDTLFSLVGGPVQINRDRTDPDPNTAAYAGQNHIVFLQPPTDHNLEHEMGHVLDFRHLAPDVVAQVAAKRRPWPAHERPLNYDDYARVNRNEYVAEAFQRALESGRRHQFADSLKVDRRLPGSIDFIRWMQTRAPFKKP